ncbi:hypothetical protein L208DRAFT_1464197, partial [Tricholoma matsutake]
MDWTLQHYSEPTKPQQLTNHRCSTPCQRWNECRCPNSATTCNYLHVCSKCSNSGHV